MVSLLSHRSMPGLVLGLVAACSTGQSTERPADAAATARTSSTTSSGTTLAPGTMITATLTGEISSRHAKAGDTFSARVVEDIANSGGRVAIPAGAMVHGTVVEVSPAANSGSAGTLTLAVNDVVVQGTTYDVAASIDSLETVREGRGVEPVDAARVAGGAAAGAILGRVIGGNAKGTVVGGVIGGAAGAAVSVAMKDVDIVLPAGSRLILRLRERLTVRRN